MNWLRQSIFLGVVAIAACTADKVVEIERITSPDGHVVAIYRQYLYGGAAGGMGHCIALMQVTGANDGDCYLLASRIEGFRMRWAGNVLTVHYRHASITKFQNEYYVVSRASGPTRYEIRLEAE